MGGHYLGCKLSYGFLMAVVSAECAVVTPIACPLVEIFLRQAVSRFSHFARGLGVVRGVDLLRSSHYKRHYREKLATVPSYINSLGRGGYTRWSQELTWPLACSRL